MAYIIDDSSKRWPKSGIPYIIDPKTLPAGAANYNKVIQGINIWNSQSPLKLIPRTDQDDYLCYYMGPTNGGCKSGVGRQGGMQHIPCDLDWEEAIPAIVHETGHAAGFIHEHQRPDRDSYVNVVNTNGDHIINRDGHAVGPYDCNSSMHYPIDNVNIKKLSSGGCLTASNSKLSNGDLLAIDYLMGAEYQTLFVQNWSKTWTKFVPYAYFTGQPYLLAYSAVTGQVHFDRLTHNSSGLEILKQATWPKGYSHLEPLALGKERYLLRYNVSKGNVDIIRLNPNGVETESVWQGQWSPGWTQVVAIGANSVNPDHILVYNANTGVVRIDRLSTGGKGTTNLWQGGWSKGWSHIMPYRLHGQNWHFLIYNDKTGRVHLDKLDNPKTGSQSLFKDTWGTGWTHFVPYPHNQFDLLGRTQFIAYNKDSGDVHFDEVGEDYFKILTTSKWGQGWTHLTPNLLQPNHLLGDQGLIAYNQTTGQAHIDRLL